MRKVQTTNLYISTERIHKAVQA